MPKLNEHVAIFLPDPLHPDIYKLLPRGSKKFDTFPRFSAVQRKLFHSEIEMQTPHFKGAYPGHVLQCNPSTFTTLFMLESRNESLLLAL